MDREKFPDKGRGPFYKKWWFWCIVAVAVIAMAANAANNDNNDRNNPSGVQATLTPDPGTRVNETTDTVQNPTGNTDTVKENSIEKDNTDANTNTNTNTTDTNLTRDNSTAVLTKLNTGTFVVGTDIPQGRYVISGDGNGNLFLSNANGEMYVNEILGGGDMGVDSVTCNIVNGDTIQISGVKNVTFTPAETKLYTDALTTGVWVVGLDVAPGRYDISSSGGNGNLIVYDQNKIPVVNEILGGGDIGVEKVTAELKEGETVSISGMKEVKLAVK